MKKIFMIAGELSGDKLGAWYVDHQLKQQGVYIEAVGGDWLKKAGVHLFERFETLNVTGIVEIVTHVPRLFAFFKKLTAYIQANNFDEIILIDFPGFNIKLAKWLKYYARNNIIITYLSPPQLWCWGEWRIKTLKRCCDKLIVIYPFEVEWYRKRNVSACWLGNPAYDRLKPYLSKTIQRRNVIALVIASRMKELTTLMPIVAPVVRNFLYTFPEVNFVIPRAESISREVLHEALKRHDLLSERVNIVEGEDEKFAVLSQCCLALTKPGTATLELALLGVPALIFYKTSWLTYWLARLVVKVPYMGLPNLLMPNPVSEEFIQHDRRLLLLGDKAEYIYRSFMQNGKKYNQLVKDVMLIKKIFE